MAQSEITPGEMSLTELVMSSSEGEIAGDGLIVVEPRDQREWAMRLAEVMEQPVKEYQVGDIFSWKEANTEFASEASMEFEFSPTALAARTALYRLRLLESQMVDEPEFGDYCRQKIDGVKEDLVYEGSPLQVELNPEVTEERRDMKDLLDLMVKAHKVVNFPGETTVVERGIWSTSRQRMLMFLLLFDEDEMFLTDKENLHARSYCWLWISQVIEWAGGDVRNRRLQEDFRNFREESRQLVAQNSVGSVFREPIYDLWASWDSRDTNARYYGYVIDSLVVRVADTREEWLEKAKIGAKELKMKGQNGDWSLEELRWMELWGLLVAKVTRGKWGGKHKKRG